VSPQLRGVVLFGDVVDSRREAAASTAFLRDLCRELEQAYPQADRLAAFGFTQGDELQGLLTVRADPFSAVLRAGLRGDARPMRWAVVAGPIEPGRGQATERTGTAFHAARDLIGQAASRRDGLVARSGDAHTDALLADLAPLLPELLASLTPRQREVGRLVLIDGLRRSEAAARLGVSRATVSIIAERGRLRHLENLARALAALFRSGTDPSASIAMTLTNPTGSAA
jgi:predicted DNA-binding protein (UPF0251 family)